MRATIRRSSTPRRIGATHEARRNLDGRRRQGRRRQPRPVAILQDDGFDATDSIAICAFTTDPTEAPLFRLPGAPSAGNGLRSCCRLMADKIAAVPKSKVGERIGRLDDEDILRLNQAVLVFLGLAASPRAKRSV